MMKQYFFIFTGNYILNYVASQPKLAPFVIQALIQVIAKITKSGWFEVQKDRFVFREIIADVKTFLQVRRPYYIIRTKVIFVCLFEKLLFLKLYSLFCGYQSDINYDLLFILQSLYFLLPGKEDHVVLTSKPEECKLCFVVSKIHVVISNCVSLCIAYMHTCIFSCILSNLMLITSL